MRVTTEFSLILKELLMQHYIKRSKCWGLQSMEMTDFLLKNKLEQIVENFKVRQTMKWWQTKTKCFLRQ